MEGVFIDDLHVYGEYPDVVHSPLLMDVDYTHSPYTHSPIWNNWPDTEHTDITTDPAIYHDPIPPSVLSQQQQSPKQESPQPASPQESPPPRLTLRGLPMRKAAMKVAARVAKIVSWENANENSDIVRRIAAQIDGEICDEASRKRKRSSTSQHNPIPAEDSECDDGADDADERDDTSEPDPVEADTAFEIHDGNDEIEDDEESENEEEYGTEYGSGDENGSETGSESENENDNEDESIVSDTFDFETPAIVDDAELVSRTIDDEELVSSVDNENVL